MAGLLLLLVAGGTAWQVTRATSEKAGRRASSPSQLGIPGSKSSRSGARDGAKSPFDSLPAHLQALLLELHEQHKSLEGDGEDQFAKTDVARKRVAALLESIGPEDAKLLITYYKDPQSNRDTNDGYDLAYHPLYERWGKLDPEGSRD